MKRLHSIPGDYNNNEVSGHIDVATFQNNVFKILLSSYTNVVVMTPDKNTLYRLMASSIFGTAY